VAQASGVTSAAAGVAADEVWQVWTNVAAGVVVNGAGVAGVAAGMAADEAASMAAGKNQQQQQRCQWRARTRATISGGREAGKATVAAGARTRLLAARLHACNNLHGPARQAVPPLHHAALQLRGMPGPHRLQSMKYPGANNLRLVKVLMQPTHTTI